MKTPQFELNMAVAMSLNILRLHRIINRRLARRIAIRVPSGSRRMRMAYSANARRYDQQRLFNRNGFRNPRRAGRKCS